MNDDNTGFGLTPETYRNAELRARQELMARALSPRKGGLASIKMALTHVILGESWGKNRPAAPLPGLRKIAELCEVKHHSQLFRARRELVERDKILLRIDKAGKDYSLNPQIDQWSDKKIDGRRIGKQLELFHDPDFNWTHHATLIEILGRHFNEPAHSPETTSNELPFAPPRAHEVHTTADAARINPDQRAPGVHGPAAEDADLQQKRAPGVHDSQTSATNGDSRRAPGVHGRDALNPTRTRKPSDIAWQNSNESEERAPQVHALAAPLRLKNPKKGNPKLMSEDLKQHLQTLKVSRDGDDLRAALVGILGEDGHNDVGKWINRLRIKGSSERETTLEVFECLIERMHDACRPAVNAPCGLAEKYFQIARGKVSCKAV
jgi:hypothetical protein